MIADRVSTKNAIDFIHNVEVAALAASSRGPVGGDEIDRSSSPSSVESIALKKAVAAAS